MTQEIPREKINSSTILNSESFGLLVILAANLVFFGPFLFVNEAVSIGSKVGDLPFLFKPMREFAAAQLSNGIFPFWEPFSMSGRPFFADPQTELLNPFTFLFLLLPSHLAFSWVYFLHFLIGGVGLFYFARRLQVSVLGATLGSLIYLFSSPHVLHLYAGHFVIVSTMAWTPWVLWAMEGFLQRPSWRGAGLFGLCLAINLYGGFVQFTYYLGCVVLVYLIWAILKGRLKGYFLKSSFQLSFATLLGLGAFIVQMYPAWELTQNSIREGGDLSFTSSYALSLENMVTLVAPKFFGELAEGDSEGQYYFGQNFVWENTSYFGVVSLTLLLTLFRRKTQSDQIFWVGIFLASFILALGNATPLFKWCFDNIPGFSLFRGYNKTLSFSCLALAILAGMQLDQLRSFTLKNSTKYLFLIVPSGLIVLFFWSEFFLDSFPFWKEQLHAKFNELGWKDLTGEKTLGFFKNFRMNLLLGLFLSLSLAAIIFSQKHKGSLSNSGAAMICVLAFIDFVFFAKPYFHSVNFKTFNLPEAFVNLPQGEHERHRAFTSDWKVSNSGYAQGFATNAGYQTFVLKEMKRFSGFFKGELLKRKGSYITSPLTNEGLKLFGVQSILGPEIIQSPIALNQMAHEDYLGDPFYLYQLEKSQSKYSLGSQLEPVYLGEEPDSGFSERYKDIVQKLYRETPETVFVSPDDYKELKSYLSSESPKERYGTIDVLHEGINKVRLRVETKFPTFLTINENFYPGWRCLIDGNETELFPANLIMKTVGVPAGSHIVDLNFLPKHFYRNAIISGLSLLILIGMIWIKPHSLTHPEKP